ncbi:MAG: hypothetical protein NXI27_26250 [Alphaproteobacteria bacterium]|nr:hypothetical protein [Alphaproteobacteria bacterium]
MKSSFIRTSGIGAIAFALGISVNIATTQAQSDAPMEPAQIAGSLSTRILSAVSGGYWEAEIEPKSAEGETAKADPVAARGYYRIAALRSMDNTSRLYLQRIRLTDDGPDMVDSVEIQALTEMKAYITDMRPESSTGIAERPGFAAFIYLKLDPKAREPDTYELFVDEFGDAAFAPATN